MSISFGMDCGQPGHISSSSVANAFEKDDHTKWRDCKCKGRPNLVSTAWRHMHTSSIERMASVWKSPASLILSREARIKCKVTEMSEMVLTKRACCITLGLGGWE